MKNPDRRIFKYPSFGVKKIGQLQFRNQKIASADFLKFTVIDFILQNSSSDQISKFEKFNFKVREILDNYSTLQEANSQRLKQLEPSHTLSYRKAIILAKYLYNLQQLSLLMVNNSVPYEIANQAANLLSNQLKFAKSLVITNLIAALIETRISDTQ